MVNAPFDLDTRLIAAYASVMKEVQQESGTKSKELSILMAIAPWLFGFLALSSFVRSLIQYTHGELGLASLILTPADLALLTWIAWETSSKSRRKT